VQETFETQLTLERYAGKQNLGDTIENFPYGVRLKRAYLGMEKWNDGDEVSVTVELLHRKARP
jgi:hypothetical protein